jgi:hypothetical protein
VLILRQKQIEAMGDQLRERFVRLMLAHLDEHFPNRVGILGPDKAREYVLEGIAKAQGFGIVAEQDVAGVIHFMFEATLQFDLAPGFEWAVAALQDAELAPTERVDRLFAEWATRKPSGVD